ncbi:hypothetical protein [Sulfurimonas sp.]|uniref:hypothetical protein n=1 Tax=Sulfurimonas sp. TaxID=2022749 RepID=UPI002B478FF0|nr:hypothetical protein [Sulfurimonas sp.]
MVKKISIFFAYTIFFMLALMYFTPKDSIYFLLEEKLKQSDIVISFEQVEDKGFFLNIVDADISFKSISSAKINEASIIVFAIYNSVSLKGITLSTTAKSFAPLNIHKAKVIYSIFNPLNVSIEAVGEFGELEGEFNIVNSTLHLELKPSQEMLKNYQSSLRKLNKTENGEFVYDKTF